MREQDGITKREREKVSPTCSTSLQIVSDQVLYDVQVCPTIQGFFQDLGQNGSIHNLL